MVIGFQERFVEKILSGVKIHTIRDDCFDRWRSDRVMHMATGVRTDHYHQFAEKTCSGVQNIEIQYNKGGGVNVFIDGSFFYYQTSWGLEWDQQTKQNMCSLAIADGFNTIAEFFAWFNKDFKGKIIHWTEKRY